jgi:hypothetical protein
MEELDMSREQSVSTTLRAALISTLISAVLTGCIFSPDKKEIIVGGGEGPKVVQNPDDLIQNLAVAYRNRNITDFAALLANDPTNKAEYLFQLDSPQLENWDYNEEVRIHQRMFEPESTPPGQSPVPAEYWLAAIQITLTRSAEFTERTDLYESASNPTGLPKDKWFASDAIYATDVFFDTQDTDFQVTGRANFVVIEDLTKNIGDAGKFLILQWNDLGASKPSASEQLPS